MWLLSLHSLKLYDHIYNNFFNSMNFTNPVANERNQSRFICTWFCLDTFGGHANGWKKSYFSSFCKNWSHAKWDLKCKRSREKAFKWSEWSVFRVQSLKSLKCRFAFFHSPALRFCSTEVKTPISTNVMQHNSICTMCWFCGQTSCACSNCTVKWTLFCKTNYFQWLKEWIAESQCTL